MLEPVGDHVGIIRENVQMTQILVQLRPCTAGAGLEINDDGIEFQRSLVGGENINSTFSEHQIGKKKSWWIAEVERAPGRSATAISLPQPLVFLLIFGSLSVS